MSGGGAEENRFRNWLRLGTTGCTFATTYAGKAATYRRIAYYTRRGLLLPAEVATLDGLIDESAKEHRFFVSLFPHVRSPRQIGDLLATLDAADRWACSHMPWKKHERPDAALIRGLHGMNPEDYNAAWKATTEDVPAVLADPPEDRVYLRQIAFCLPREVAQGLTFKDGSSAP